MHPIFHVSSDAIQNLTDTQARELIARLCKAELREKGASTVAVSWGGDQRAKDGGIDVYVEVSPRIGISGYIQNDCCAFQVKAEKFAPSKIPNEMAPNGVLRQAIKEVALKGGAYVIASTKDSLSDSSLKMRRNAMNDCLASYSLPGRVELDFYDSRRIADWIEQHPSIVTWVKAASGKPLAGWKPYGPWAYQENNAKAEYLIDDRVKVFIPDADEGSEISTAIKRLRLDLSMNVSVRIVGLSGVGKTRLVQALFDDRVCPEQPALDQDNVVYADLADGPSPQPAAMVEALFGSGSDCVVVIDNCGPEVHQRLTEIAKRPGSKLRLITVEYDIRDDLPEGTVCYRLEGSSDEIIKVLLKRRYECLSEPDIDKIVEFSDGNARVAFALASTAETKGELARLRDGELFKRLFHQKNIENGELLKCAEAASLLYSFDGEDTSPKSEISVLAGLAEVSNVTFLGNVVELQRRGLLQQRGKWRAVLPHAISNRLAASAVEIYQPELLNRLLVDEASDRVMRSFSRRLGYLHESKPAAKIISKWLKTDGCLGDLTKLSDVGLAMFSNVAPVCEEAALAALDRAVEQSDFTSTENTNRHKFIRLARSIAYDPSFFDRAVEVLIRFAIAEPPNYNHEPSREVLKSLFQCHLSGTEAKSSQRSKVVRTLLYSPDDRERRLGFRLLDAALESSHFSSYYGFEFGARRRGYGWSPRMRDDVRDWFAPFIDIAVEIGCKKSVQAQEARLVLGEALRGLWVNAGLTDEIAAAAQAFQAIGGWPEGWLGARRVLQYDQKSLSSDSLELLRKLERELAPRGLKEEICAKVIAKGSFAHDMELDESHDSVVGAASRYEASRQAAETLGRSAAHEEVLLNELLPELLRNDGAKVWCFGFGVGQESPDVAALLAYARTLITEGERGSNSQNFILGVLSGWNKVRPSEVPAFLDQALDDESWGWWFPDLQIHVGLDNTAYQRLLKSLRLDTAPIWQYQYLGMGRATDPLSVSQIAELIDVISRKTDGLDVALDIFGMVIHCASEKDDEYRRELGRAAVTFLRNLDWSKIQSDNDRVDHELDMILGFALAAQSVDDAEKLVVLRGLVDFERSESRSYSYSRGRWLAPFFKYFPKEALDAIYVPDSDGFYRTAKRIVSRFDSDNRETAIHNVPADALAEWCEASPTDRCIFAAETCRLFEKSAENTDSFSISEAAIRVLAAAEDKTKVLEIFIERFRSQGWSGNLSAVLRRRAPLLRKLNPNADPELHEKIVAAEKVFADLISRAEKSEEAEERGRSESFE